MTFCKFIFELILRNFMDKLSIEKCDLLGFSMGGKVAMNFSLDTTVEPEKRIRKLIIVDTAPISQIYYNGSSEILNILLSVDLPKYTTKEEVDTFLSKEIESQKMRNFLLSNIQETPNGLAWKVNLDSIANNFVEIQDFVKSENTFHNDTLFIRGSNSPLCTVKHEPIIKKHFPNSKIVTFESVGHWVHVESPKKFIEETCNFINE